MSEFKSPNFRNEDGSAAPDIVGVTTFTSPYYFVPPSGTTAERPSGDGLAPGMLRFNTDIGRLEVWRGDHWATILGESPNLGNQLVSNSAGGTGTRAVIAGGFSPDPSPGVTYADMDYITIEILGVAQDFGDLSAGRSSSATASDTTRGLFQGGGAPTITSSTRKFTFASTGSDANFGNLITSFAHHFGCSNSTRGVFGGSQAPTYSTTLEYVTIQADGTASDFGDITSGLYRRGSVCSSTRGVIMGNYAPSGDAYNNWNTIEYITIASTGDAQDFGDLTTTSSDSSSTSNSIRGIRFGKWPTAPTTPQALAEVMDYITIATRGDAQDFGDLTPSTRYHTHSTASSTRAVICGGTASTAPQVTSRIDYVTIATTGNSLEFGSLVVAARGRSAVSNGHGGL